MSSANDKAKGLMNEGAGKAKQAWGDLTDNPKAKGEGLAQEAKGKGQQAVGEIKETIKKDLPIY